MKKFTQEDLELQQIAFYMIANILMVSWATVQVIETLVRFARWL